jgi:membrane-associated phospholipid phosphatase
LALLKLRDKSDLLCHRNHLTIEMLILLCRLSALFPKRDFVAGRKAPDVAFIQPSAGLSFEFQMLNGFDAYLMELMSRYSQTSLIANKLIIKFLDLNSVKLGPFVVGLWLLWYSKTLKLRSAVVEAFLSMIAAIAISRLLGSFLPERLRPLHSGNPDFILPLGVDSRVLEHWSSFPSDHAALFFAVSTTIWRFSRPLGAACYAWSIFVVCIPRIYAGYHYASDIIAGAALGVFTALVVARPLQIWLMPWIADVERKYTAVFYSMFFVLSYEFMTMFDEAREVGNAIRRLVL